MFAQIEAIVGGCWGWGKRKIWGGHLPPLAPHSAATACRAYVWICHAILAHFHVVFDFHVMKLNLSYAVSTTCYQNVFELLVPSLLTTSYKVFEVNVLGTSCSNILLQIKNLFTTKLFLFSTQKVQILLLLVPMTLPKQNLNQEPRIHQVAAVRKLHPQSLLHQKLQLRKPLHHLKTLRGKNSHRGDHLLA